MIDVILETDGSRRELVRRAVEGLGDEFIERIKAANTILIKPNLIDPENQLASTHVDAVRAVIEVIQEHSPAKIYVGDAAYFGTKAAFRNLGYEQLLKEYLKVELVDLNDDAFVDGYSIRQDGSRNSIRRSKLANDVDFRISISNMKVNRETSVSLGIKNWALGTWIVPSRISAMGRVWARWPWLNEEGAWAHHKSIAEIFNQLPADVSVIDGIQAMEGNESTNGSAVNMGVVLAGFDAVAVDAVASTLMGVDPTTVGYLVMASEAGLGSVDMSKINVPPMQMAVLTRKFNRPPNFDENSSAWRSASPDVIISEQ